MGKCPFLGNIIDIIMGMFGGLLLKLVLMIVIDGLWVLRLGKTAGGMQCLRYS